MTDKATANNVLVETLGSSLRYGGEALGNVPALLARVLRDEAWREFRTRRGELVEHERFEDFVTTSPLAGLGTTVDLVWRIVADDVETKDLLDQALQNPVGKPSIDNNIQDKAPQGTSEARALRKLRKDAPELHTQVLAGELSAHAAMVQAGYRPRTFTVRADDPDRIAATLRRQLDDDTLAAVTQLLAGEAQCRGSK